MLSKMSESERQMPCDLSHMWNLNKTNTKTENTFINTENRLVVSRERGEE